MKTTLRKAGQVLCILVNDRLLTSSVFFRNTLLSHSPQVVPGDGGQQHEAE